ncbi:MAG TPA: ATP phosphoribosyltransferase [Symbiobacteriaceae bacterium]|nr:ATP phosphoribosyltransferase [Symbiobacteriaceae bacterium]
MELLTIALPKGRPYTEARRLLQAIGLAGETLTEQEPRQLLLPDPERGVQYLIARDADVPTYVEWGAADLGVVGKNVLMEAEPQVYELLDLGFSQCQFILAAPAELDTASLLSGATHCRVATKYPKMTAQYFAERGLQVETIFLHGSIEVAPKVGLADLIVDITETGRTLRENNLVIVDRLWSSSMRLVANRSAYQLKAEAIDRVVGLLRSAIAQPIG